MRNTTLLLFISQLWNIKYVGAGAWQHSRIIFETVFVKEKVGSKAVASLDAVGGRSFMEQMCNKCLAELYICSWLQNLMLVLKCKVYN